MRKNVGFRVIGIVMFMAGTFGLWYGFAMSFLMPGNPGEAYFQKDRFLLGNLPLLGLPLVLSAAGWMVFHSLSEPRITLGQAINYSIVGAAGLGLVYAVFCALIYQLWGGVNLGF